ncbi:MAG: VOC family protein [Paracoccaceae bacterium]
MTYKTHPETRIGHIHLRVADLDRAIAFYRDVMGFEVQQKYGDQAAFLSAGNYHHHIGLNTWQSKGGTPPPAGHTGLFHAAFLYPDRKALARAFRQLLDAGVALEGATDHGVSEAIYFSDPDKNGLEIYRDRDPLDWPRNAKGDLEFTSTRLDIDSLLAELTDEN